MRRIVLFYILFVGHALSTIGASVLTVHSPDSGVVAVIRVGERITYEVSFHGSSVLERSQLGFQFAQSPFLGTDMEVVEHHAHVIDTTWHPVAGQYSSVRDHARELTLRLRERRFPCRSLEVTFRAYNDGVAFRYRVPGTMRRFIPNFQDAHRLLLMDEKTQFVFSQNHEAWVADYGGYNTHQESEFVKTRLLHIAEGAVIGLPMLVKAGPAAYAAIAEAALTDWSGMYLNPAATATGPALEVELAPLPGREGKVMVAPGQASPWRVIMLGKSPGALVESEIVNNLNDPCAIDDPSWIQPGISAWDHWWSGEVQMDTETILKYVQLAADMGWEYMLIDWHWYGNPFAAEVGGEADPSADITSVNPAVDLEAVRAFADERGVKLLLWLLWPHADRQLDEAFALYEQWGIAGVKIDFMTRDDQDMVNWYHKVVKKAAEHNLVVNFHGAYKPTGWSRTYPNLLTREGVLGNEYSKWSARITPEHNTTLPFTRMLAGQMDFTPGGFLNRSKGAFRTGAPAQVMGSRAHQLAMFVVYFSPLTVACDHPDNYRGQEGVEFLREVPTIWEDTRVLAGDVGEYIVIARKNQGRWFLGAMTNSMSRDLTVDLAFLGSGRWTLHYWRDTSGSMADAAVVERGSRIVSSEEILNINMVGGGGYAAYLEQK